MAKTAALGEMLNTDAGLEQRCLIHVSGKAVQQDSSNPFSDVLVNVALQNRLDNLCWDELALSHECRDVRTLLLQHPLRFGSEKIADRQMRSAEVFGEFCALCAFTNTRST